MKYSTDFYSYWLDLVSRSILYFQALRERGKQQARFERNGCSKVLSFPIKRIISGNELGINYDLMRVQGKAQSGKRAHVYIDPRAGRGPGICGSKEMSQIGLSLQAGHPTYFIPFAKEPVAGQTIESVVKGLTVFIEEINRRHLGFGRAQMIGNCQAGWLLALMAARYPEKVNGPLVSVGAPWSYWSGSNSMQHKGMVMGGGMWMALLGDIGDEVIDGANFSGNFEIHDSSVVIGRKHLELFKDPSRKNVERFLSQEKWWNRFFSMTKAEGEWVTDNLFIGNKLENGQLELDGQVLNLDNIQSPIVVFASRGDTITSPAQALGWIPAVYESRDAIRESGRTIVYLLHPSCGHLAIFGSAKVADLYHRAIIDNMARIEDMPAGLYEMVFTDAGRVLIQERAVNDIRALDDCQLWEKTAYKHAARQSEQIKAVYKATVGPIIKACAWSMPNTTKRKVHPMRFTRKVYTGFSPLDSAVKTCQNYASGDRLKEGKNNIFKEVEGMWQDTFLSLWNFWENSQKDCYKMMARLF